MDMQRVRLKRTFTNTVTGTSITTPDVGIDKITMHKDGSSTVMTIGLLGHFPVPGEGLVAVNVGVIRLTFDADGNLVSAVEHGQHDGPFFPQFCSALQ